MGNCFVNRAFSAMWLALLVAGLTSGGSPGAAELRFIPITGDADSEISAAKTYTHTVDFGNGTAATINDVVFTRNTNTPMAGLILSGTNNSHNGNADTGVADTEGIHQLLMDMVYRNPPGGTQLITLNNLTPGQEYDVRIYVRPWVAGAERRHTIRFDIDSDGIIDDTIDSINEDNPTEDPPGFINANQAYIMSYTFYSHGSITIDLTALGDGNWHIYGLTNEETDSPLQMAAGFNGAPALPTAGVLPLEIAFTDQSANNGVDAITEWAWDFGDGGTSTEQNPTHTYTEVGVYDVSLTVTDAIGGQDATTRFGAVTVLSDRFEFIPLGQDTADADSDIALRKVYTHALDFGTNAPATVNGVQFTLVDSTDAVAGVDGFDTEMNTYHAGNANTGVNPEQGIHALLTDMVYGGLTQGFTFSGLTDGETYDLRLYIRSWDPGALRENTLSFDLGMDGVFEDVVTIREDNATFAPPALDTATHAYILSYTYVADASGLLRVQIDPAGAETFHLYGVTNEVPNAAGFLVAGFKTIPSTPIYGHAPLEIQFNDLSTSDGVSPIASWSWDFGDGQTSAEQNPTHTYTAPGIYTVTLTVTDESGAQATASLARAVVVPSDNLRFIPLFPSSADADSGISPGKEYTHALDFGTGAGAVVNGLTFTRVNNADAQAAVPNFTQDFDNYHGGNGATGVASDQGIHQLLFDMVYGGGTGFTITGLTPNLTYEARIYTRQWGSPSVRPGEFGFDIGNDTVVEEFVALSQDNATKNPPGFETENRAYMIAYKYVADASGALRVNITSPDAASTWHLYGVTNEVIVPQQLNFAETASSGAEADSPIRIKVNLTSPVNGDVTFTYSTLNARATSPKDFTGVTDGQGTILSGELEGEFTISIQDNAYPENDKDFWVVITDVSGGAVLGHSLAYHYTIEDDDAAEMLVVNNPSFETPERSTIGWPGYTAIDDWSAITVSNVGINAHQDGDNPFANGNSPLGDQVALIQINGGIDNGLSQVISGFSAGTAYVVSLQTNARPDQSPYIAVSLDGQTIIPRQLIQAGAYRTLQGEFLSEVDGDLELSIISPGRDGDHTLLVDDVQVYKAFLEVKFTQAASSGVEGMPIDLSVRLSVPAPAGGITVDYTTVDGSAIAGVDYEAASGQITFQAGQTMQNIRIDTIDNGLRDDTRTLMVQLGNRTGDVAMGNEWMHEYTIIDDDIDLETGLIGYWPFDESEGDIAADLSGSAVAYDATLTSGAVFAPGEGFKGGALRLSGNDQNAQTELITSSDDGTTSLTNRLTITGWIKGAPNHHAALMVSRDQNSGYPNAGLYAERMTGTGEANYMWNDQYYTLSTGLRWPGPDVWTFLAVSIAPDEATVYLGAEGEPLQSWTNVAPHEAIGLGYWAIGRDTGWPALPDPFHDRFIDGLIDDVRFYQRSLTYSDIWGMFQADSPEKTPIVINEIMYMSEYGDQYEFVELVNYASRTVDLSGWTLSEGIDFTFPDGVVLDGGDYLVIARSQTDVQDLYGIQNVIGNFSGDLSDDGERLILTDADSAVIDDVTYGSQPPWPEDAQGFGSSLELYSPRVDNADIRYWLASTPPENGGTPGGENSVVSLPTPPPVILPTPSPAPTETPSTGDPTPTPTIDPTPMPTETIQPTPTVIPSFDDMDMDGRGDDCETSDSELLSQGWTNIYLPDSDGDGLMDGDEAPGDCAFTTIPLALTDPLVRDTDGDGLSDGVEVLLLNSDPLDANDPAAYTDADNDGLPDSVDPDDSTNDLDGDRYTDAYEILIGSNPDDSNSIPDLGNINGDGQTNNLDAIIMFNWTLGNVESLAHFDRGDVQINGMINNLDAIILFNWTLGNVMTLPM